MMKINSISLGISLILLLGCQHDMAPKSYILPVQYPYLYSDRSMVQGGFCVHGAVLMLAAYVQGFTPTRVRLTDSVETMPVVYPANIARLAEKQYGLTLQKAQVTEGQIRASLESNRPLIALIEGDHRLDVILIVGIDHEAVIAHYPAWSFTGSGAYQRIVFSRFRELQAASHGWGYILR